jgi:hypothetical protein
MTRDPASRVTVDPGGLVCSGCRTKLAGVRANDRLQQSRKPCMRFCAQHTCSLCMGPGAGTGALLNRKALDGSNSNDFYPGHD